MRAALVVAVLLIASTGSFAKPVSDEEDTALAQLSDLLPDDSEEKGDPSEFYLNEVREQVESERNLPARNKRSGFNFFSVSKASTAISHEGRIAIQPLHDKLNWMSCSGSLCGKAACPSLYMEGADWVNCWGQVFQIYRAAGPGDVKVGDVIGIYYPRDSLWLGCAGLKCGKASCPGLPTVEYGFQNTEKWYRCFGEVFKIYARGKELGDTIDSHDDIAIFYIQGQNWIGLPDTHAIHQTCSGAVRPPPEERYDYCAKEVYEIVKG